jgi:hypothetical protein
VGPQYTFASELQAELVAMQSELEADQYSLQIVTDDKDKRQSESVGALLTDVQCHQALSVARQRYHVQQQKGKRAKQQKQKQQSLKDYLSTEVRCWKRALAALDEYRTKGQSVIISNERISSQWYKSSNGLGSGGGGSSSLASLDFMALHETLGDAWNVEVVVAYRRYAEWLPDAVRGAAEYRYQQVKLFGSSLPLSKRRAVVDVNNAAILPLVPDLIESAAVTGQAIVGGGNTQLENATYTATVLERYLSLDASSTSSSSSSSTTTILFPITLFNVHDNDLSLGGHFVCHTCTTPCRPVAITCSIRRACRATLAMPNTSAIANRPKPKIFTTCWPFTVVNNTCTIPT